MLDTLDIQASGAELLPGEAEIALLGDERSLRQEIADVEAVSLRSIHESAQASMAPLARAHACRLCLRWFGLTYANGTGHYSDTKSEHARKMRQRNRRPSYLMCASCGDLPMFCHTCYRMVHLDEEPTIVSTVDAAIAELKKQQQQEQQSQQQQLLLATDSDDTVSRSSPVVPSEEGAVPTAAAAQAQPPFHDGTGNPKEDPEASLHNVLPASVLKRSGLATLAAVTVAGSLHVSNAGGGSRASSFASPTRGGGDGGASSRGGSAATKRHVAVEITSLDLNVSLQHRRAIKAFLKRDFRHELLDGEAPLMAPGSDRPLPLFVQVALGEVQAREERRRCEIDALWHRERFSLQTVRSNWCVPSLRDNGREEAAELSVHGEAGIETTAGVTTMPAAPQVPFTVSITGPEDTASGTSPLSTTRSGTSPKAAGPAWQNVLVDNLALDFLMYACDSGTADVMQQETCARAEILGHHVTDRNRRFAEQASRDAMWQITVQAAALAYLREMQREATAMLEQAHASVAPLHEELVVNGVTRVLDGSLLHEAGELDEETTDDDGVPMTLRWLRFHLAESIARRQLWDEQVESMVPIVRDAQWREQATERVLMSRSLFQQHHFQTQQLMRQFVVTHQSTVASKMLEYVTLLGDRAEKRVDQLTFQCTHAITRQELVDWERRDRTSNRHAYAVSRLVSRESAIRRGVLVEAWYTLLRELPTEEKLKRFTIERQFVVEYRSLVRDFWAQTRMDLATLTRNCSHTFETFLSDVTRRVLQRENTFFAFKRDSMTVGYPCGVPIASCFKWPVDDCRRLSLSWCPVYGPPRKKVIANVPQGSAARSLRVRQGGGAAVVGAAGSSKGPGSVLLRPSAAPALSPATLGSKSATDAPSNLLTVGGVGGDAGGGLPPSLTPRSTSGGVVGGMNNTVPSPTFRFVDDGPQPLLSALSAVAALQEVPCFTGEVKFTCVALVEDIACWWRSCESGQLLLAANAESRAFEELFAEFDEATIAVAERKWMEMVHMRERERLASLERVIPKRAPRADTRQGDSTAGSGRRRRRRGGRISDSASSVVSGDETATTAVTSSAFDCTSGSGDESAGSRPASHLPFTLVSRTGKPLRGAELAVASLPNYHMRNSFFGARFMFGESVRVFRHQWIPPLQRGLCEIPDDLSRLWGHSIAEITLLDATTRRSANGGGKQGEDDAGGDGEATGGDGDEIGSDFDDGAVAATRRQRGAYRSGTRASAARQTEKLDVRRQQQREAEMLQAEHRSRQMKLFWKLVLERQEAEVEAAKTAAAEARDASEHAGRGRRQRSKSLPEFMLSPDLMMEPSIAIPSTSLARHGSGVDMALSPALSPGQHSRSKLSHHSAAATGPTPTATSTARTPIAAARGNNGGPSVKSAPGSPQQHAGGGGRRTKPVEVTLMDAFDMFDD